MVLAEHDNRIILVCMMPISDRVIAQHISLSQLLLLLLSYPHVLRVALPDDCMLKETRGRLATFFYRRSLKGTY